MAGNDEIGGADDSFIYIHVVKIVVQHLGNKIRATGMWHRTLCFAYWAGALLNGGMAAPHSLKEASSLLFVQS